MQGVLAMSNKSYRFYFFYYEITLPPGVRRTHPLSRFAAGPTGGQTFDY